jgi:tetratricopeptide (TPR) repeat protein
VLTTRCRADARTVPSTPKNRRVSARSFRSEWVWVPLVLIALLAIYLPGLGNLPVFDDAYLAEGTLLRDYASWRELRTRMLSYGSFVWVQALFGEGWWKQRLGNLAIHAGVVAALWALYREILRHIAASSPEARDTPAPPYAESPALGFAIGFFALNPVAVYAVAYLIQRSILLATLFVVLGLWCFARGLATRHARFHVAALACYALAVMSKEHAILAPLAAVPLYILIARPAPRRLALLSAAGLLLVAAAGALLALRYGEIIGKPFDEYSHVYLAQLSQLSPDAARHAFPLSILNQSYLFFEYGLRWFLPAEGWMSINLRPPFPVAWASFPQALGAIGYLAVLGGGFFLLLRYRDGRALLGVSLLLPALLFATEFATVWVQDPFVLYRSYLWAIGVPGLAFFAVHGIPRAAVLVAGLVVGALLSWQAVDRVASLETPEVAWSDAIQKLPKDPRSVGRWFPYLNRGTEYVERNEFALAMKDFEASSALGDLGMGVFNLGAVLAATGRHAQALAAFEAAEKQGYRLFNLPFQRGLSLLATGKPAEAYRQFELTRALQPPSPTRELMYLHLGRTGLQLGKRDEAARDLEQLVAIDPRHKEGRFLLAMAHITRGDPARALPILDQLLAEQPSGAAFYGRALAHHGLNRKAEALADIDNAIRIGPDNPNLRAWQAKIRAMR